MEASPNAENSSTENETGTSDNEVSDDDIRDHSSEAEVITKTSQCYSGNLLSSMMKLKCNGDFCDVTIKCKSYTVRAHKVVLGSATDYFKGMFLNKTKEAKSGVVDFPKMSPEVVKQCIEFIYSGKVDISMKIARDLLDASEMMQLTELSRLCVDFLAERVDMKSCTEIIRLSILYNEGSLNESVKTFLMSNFPEFSQSDDFSSLEFDVLKIIFDLLEKDSESVELQKWKAVVMWTNANLESRKCRFVELFQMVNLQCMSESDIRENIWTNSLVDESVQCMRLVRNAMINRPISNEKSVAKLLESKANNTSHIVSINGIAGLIPEIALATFQASTGRFPVKFNPEMDLIYYQGCLYVGTGLKIYKFTNKRWVLYNVDFSKVRRNQNSLTCTSCFKDHWYIGLIRDLYQITSSGKMYEINARETNMWDGNTLWRTQEHGQPCYHVSYECRNCTNVMKRENFGTCCYSRCIGLGDSVCMLTMNYIVEYRMSASQLIHHNIVIGLGNGFSVAASNDRIYAVGGNGTETKAIAFDLVTFQIIQLPNMAQRCTFGYSVIKDNKLYACSRNRSCTKWVHVQTKDSEPQVREQDVTIMHPATPIYFGRNLLMDMAQANAMTSSCFGELAKRPRLV